MRAVPVAAAEAYPVNRLCRHLFKRFGHFAQHHCLNGLSAIVSRISLNIARLSALVSGTSLNITA